MEHAHRPLIWRIIAVTSVIIAFVCAGLSVYFDRHFPGGPEFGSASATALATLALVLPGALLLWQLGPHPMALLLTTFGLLGALDGPAVGVVNQALATGEVTELAKWSFWYYVRAASVLSLAVQLILVLFPDGRLPRGRWRAVAISALALAAVMPLTFLFAPASVLTADAPDRAASLELLDPGVLSLLLPNGVWRVLLTIAFPCTLISAVLALAVLISRRRDATTERRAQLRWLIWAGLMFVMLMTLLRFMPPVVSDIAFALGIGLIGFAIVLAVTRHGLYRIDRLLSWTIIYGVLLGSVALVDVALYALAGSLFDNRALSLIAVLVVVAIYTPLRDRLYRLVSRWVNGTRGDPYAVVSELATRLETAGTPEQQLDELASSLSNAFASSHVRVELDRGDGSALAAQTGAPTDQLIELPLTYDGAEIGRIWMQPGRRPVISQRDRQLLGDLVRLAAAALRNADLNRELQTIREHLVTTREADRARLRRELHDGLGPLLGGIRLRLETARNLAEKDPESARRVLDTAIAESSDVVDEIRRLVYDLRPPALDDLGLARAIEQQAGRLSSDGLRVAVTAEPDLALSPAVEVAAYRIASEALTNIAKHAEARNAAVRLFAEPNALIVEIEDDGVGIDPTRPAGIGLMSIRERAHELGGTATIGATQRGTRVRASLPTRADTTSNPRSSHEFN